MEEQIVKNRALDRAKWFVAILLITILTIVTLLETIMMDARNRMSTDAFAVYQMNRILDQEKEKPNDIFAVRSLLETKGYSTFDTYHENYQIGWVQEKNKIVLVEEQAVIYPSNMKKYEMDSVTFLKQDTISSESELLDKLESLRSVSKGWFSFKIMDNLSFHVPILIKTNACVEFDLSGYALEVNENGIQIQGTGTYVVKNGDVHHFTVDETKMTPACLSLLGSGSLLVENCTIESACYGFTVNDATSQNANVTFYHCQMDCPYPFYISATGNYQIQEVTATGESVFCSGNITLENSTFISDSVQSKVYDNKDVKDDFDNHPSGCNSYGDAILIVDRRGNDYHLGTFLINHVIFRAATYHREPTGYGLRYIDMHANGENPITITRNDDSFPQVDGNPQNALGGYTFA